VEEAARARFLAEFTLSTQSEIPSLRSGQALRCAQDDSEGLGMTVLGNESRELEITARGRSEQMDEDKSQESQPLYCPQCGEVVEPLVCGDCGAVICRKCGTPLERVDELGIG